MEEWQQDAFWAARGPEASLGPRRVWAVYVHYSRSPLAAALDGLAADVDADADARLRYATAVRAATAATFNSWAQTSTVASTARAVAGVVGTITAVGLALIATSRWGLGAAGAALGFVAQAVFFTGAELFARGVFPGSLHWAAGLPRWSPTARLYARTVLYLACGLASLVTVLTLSDRHHHLSYLAKLAIASPLGGLAAVLGLWTAIAVKALGGFTHSPADPHPELTLALMRAYASLHIYRRTPGRQPPGLLAAERRWVALTLESAARAMLTDSGLTGRLDRDYSPAVTTALSAQGATIAAWVHSVERHVLSSSAAEDLAAEQKLATGFAAACEERWADLTPDEADPGAPPEKSVSPLVRWAPRLLTTAGLLAAAFIIPALLGSTLTGAARTTFTVTLALTALTALAAPSAAVSSVAADVAQVKAPGTDNHPA
jgi:hypothetical protein